LLKTSRKSFFGVIGRGTPRANQLIPDLIKMTLPRNASSNGMSNVVF